jgi:uncharacterized protein YcbK (DUF882 family)
MNDLSENFSSQEFACKGEDCCDGTSVVSVVLVRALEILRMWVEKSNDGVALPIIVTSGFRCNRHNKEVGGVGGSEHTKGLAADVHVSGYTSEELAELCEKVNPFKCGGIGIYPNHVHVDVRTTGQARWRNESA